MQVYEFTTSDDGGRRGSAKYRVFGTDVVFRQDFEQGFGPGTRDIMIWNGAGRWAKMKFVNCRCCLLCHWPGETSDAQVKITSRACDGAEPHYIVEFHPIAAAAAVTTHFFRTVDDQGRQGGTKYRVIGTGVTWALENEANNRVKITLTAMEPDAQVTVGFLQTTAETSGSAN